jgi:hypothetical protein
MFHCIITSTLGQHTFVQVIVVAIIFVVLGDCCEFSLQSRCCSPFLSSTVSHLFPYVSMLSSRCPACCSFLRTSLKTNLLWYFPSCVLFFIRHIISLMSIIFNTEFTLLLHTKYSFNFSGKQGDSLVKY